MEEKTFKILEYDKILLRLSEHATSEVGKELCLRLKPSSNLNHIRTWQKNTSDACSRIRLSGRSISFGGVKDIREILKRLEMGAALSAAELIKVSSILNIADRAKRFDNLEEGCEDSLSEMFEMLEPVTAVNKVIQRSVLDEDTIADDASPGLFEVRKKMQRTESSIHETMAAKLNSCRDYLTDAVITMRDSRYCLPVKAEHKSKVPGIVHDSSSTGLTLFIEPMAVVNLNNELTELKGAELKEIEKILFELSQELMPFTDAIADDIKLLKKLDMIFAKALYSMEIDGTEPVFTKDRSIDFKDARHPLIDKSMVVPVNIRLGRDFGLLITTGPNTGGKTVSLKTAGLITLMAQSGLHIPAAEGSAAGIYENIFADIGDEQSIEQSLSTFSAHMKSIVHILEKADSASLCLFDELGSGTDPTEGAALGIAILDFLHNMRINTMATTHYAELKVYALETPGVENACCEFDVETLKPTYKLLIGMPGKSNAFLISEKLGLPAYIIDAAKERISSDNESFEAVIQKLDKDRIAAEKMRKEAEQFRTEAEELKNRLKAKEDRFEKNRSRILDDAKAEAHRILKEAKETADSAIKNINQLKSVSDFNKAEQERERLRKNLKDTASVTSFGEKGPSKPVSPKKLKIGDMVRVMPMGGVTGEVISLPDKDNNITVRIGFMQTRVGVRDIEAAAETKNSKQKPAVKKSSGYSPKALSISHELNLIGMTTDEALPVLEKYLDDAYLAHLDSVRIVHGRGTGALKNMVHSQLKKIKYVDTYRLGVFGEGDSGVTIVNFK